MPLPFILKNEHFVNSTLLPFSRPNLCDIIAGIDKVKQSFLMINKKERVMKK